MAKDGSYDDGKLVVVTDSQVIAIKLHRCNSEKITSCSECVALQDPYCGWDKIAGKCRSHGAPKWLEENYYYQNVSTGQHAACPSGKMSSKDANAGEQKGKWNKPATKVHRNALAMPANATNTKTKSNLFESIQ